MLPSQHSIFFDDLPLWSAPFGLTLLDTIRMKSHINVLDIGSGSGFPMLELAERMGRTCMVYGLDPSEDAIKMITAKKDLKGIGPVKIMKGIAEAIPFPDGYFGLIVSNNGLNNVTDQVAALAECYRVADCDSQMVMTMNLPHTMTEFYDIFEELLHEKDLNEEVVKLHEHIGQKRKPVEYLKELITEAGFAIRSIQVEGFKMRFSDGSAFLNHHLIRHAFMEHWVQIPPPGMSDQFFETLEQRLNMVAVKDGEFVVSIPYVCFDCIKS